MAVSSAFSVIGLATSLGVGIIFLTTGVAKFRYRLLLPGVIANYRLLPERLVSPAAMLLPFAEIAVGVGLIAGMAPAPAIFAIMMLWIFAAAMATNIRRGRSQIDCGCGRSQLRQSLSWTLVGRNLVLSALLLLRLVPSPHYSMIDITTAVAGGMSLYLVYLLLNSVEALMASPITTMRR